MDNENNTQQNQITYEQAFNNLNIAVGELRLTRQEHNIINASLLKIKELVDQSTSQTQKVIKK